MDGFRYRFNRAQNSFNRAQYHFCLLGGGEARERGRVEARKRTYCSGCAGVWLRVCGCVAPGVR
eukprot:933685-Prorocentrum_minimum.AAC.1